jgi:hypothetical protein
MLVLLSLSTAFAHPPAVRRVVREIRAAAPQCTLTPEHDEVWTLACPDGQSSTFMFDRLVDICATDAAGCATMTHNFAVMAAPGASAGNHNLDRVVPIVRPHEQVVGWEAVEATKGAHLVTQSLSPDLDLVWVFDQPESVEMMTTDDLSKLQMDPTGLRSLGVANCTRLANVVTRVPMHGAEGVVLGDYGGCALVMPATTYSVDHAPVTLFVMPTASLLLLTTAKDPSEGCWLPEAARQLQQRSPAGEHVLPVQAFLASGDQWVPGGCRPAP